MKSSFEINNDEAIIKINKNIYTKEVIIQTTYVMLENFYFLIDEDEKYFLVSIKAKQIKDKNKTKEILEQGIYDFFDELIESNSYIDQLKRTSKIRETILEKALLTQTLDSELIEELEKENIK